MKKQFKVLPIFLIIISSSYSMTKYSSYDVKMSISFKKQEIQKDDPMKRFYKYIKELAKEAGIEDIMKNEGFSFSGSEFVIGDKKMSEEMKNKAIKEYEKIFEHPIGDNSIDIRPAKN